MCPRLKYWEYGLKTSLKVWTIRDSGYKNWLYPIVRNYERNSWMKSQYSELQRWENNQSLFNAKKWLQRGIIRTEVGNKHIIFYQENRKQMREMTKAMKPITPTKNSIEIKPKIESNQTEIEQG